jgi:calpain-15
MKWKKIEKVFPDGKIFVGKVEPCDIKQGFLGDCYFLAGLAAISERPDRIIDLFVTKKRNNLNYYSIKMLYKGKWRIVDLDDKIPTIYNKPAFANSSEK